MGYTGSQDYNTNQFPTYTDIKDYAESIRIIFDDSKMSYEDLLNMFFAFHTPENPAWCGTQYRSAIFYHTDEQRQKAEEVVQSWGALGKFVAIEPAGPFYRAEEYHQKYMEKF